MGYILKKRKGKKSTSRQHWILKPNRRKCQVGQHISMDPTTSEI
jgi:hypothetical protein